MNCKAKVLAAVGNLAIKPRLIASYFEAIRRCIRSNSHFPLPVTEAQHLRAPASNPETPAPSRQLPPGRIDGVPVPQDREAYDVEFGELAGLVEREGVAGGWLSKKWSDAMFKKQSCLTLFVWGGL